jgi:hypothetical protein
LDPADQTVIANHRKICCDGGHGSECEREESLEQYALRVNYYRARTEKAGNINIVRKERIEEEVEP